MELFSLFGYLLPDFRQIAFFVIVALTLILSLKNLKYGVLIMFAELFIGSKGYLFYFEHSGLIISIRIALWLVIMSVWLGGKIRKIRIKRIKREIRIKIRELYFSFYSYFSSRFSDSYSSSRFSSFSHFFSSRSFHSYFLILFIFIAWGVINGFLNHNEFSNIFFDFNGWLYFALFFPIYKVFTIGKDIRCPKKTEVGPADSAGPTSVFFGHRMSVFYSLSQIFIASITWLSFKTFFILFIFSHNIPGTLFPLYKWIRTSGVGEITQMQGGFYRIFFQSHIFILIGFFILLFLLLQITTQKITTQKMTGQANYELRGIALCVMRYTLCVSCLLSTILISFSRSFWAGLIVGLMLYGCIIIWLYGWKKLIQNFSILLVTGILSIGLIAAIVKFPYPDPLGGFNTAELLSERASNISDEAAVSSRWNLLPKLWSKIKSAPILGSGFGTTITYKSSDPRVLSSTVDGEYMTYAFEWGWLDIWLKLGFFGMLAYFVLIGKIIYTGFKVMQKVKIRQNLLQFATADYDEVSKNIIDLGLVVGLVVVAVVSIFSPYLNHPLGIGYVLIVSCITWNV
ncbi:O-antigen ligase family protein [Patescibacteria group bacterium]|nr:O-antigen ligase family protein [Patescibacteria group bacterium]